MSTTTPADRAAQFDKVAAANLASAARIAQLYEDNVTMETDVREAGAAIRLLVVGALTDPSVSASKGRHITRAHLRALMHDDSHSRGVLGVYRRCFNAIDGKE